ncbi:MAG: hypothetical protein C6W58_14830 [Bacillaceae bacterium]|nr:MAG: hypothetical protein C6W58_14830 [Bacillaceae bacterium]
MKNNFFQIGASSSRLLVLILPFVTYFPIKSMNSAHSFSQNQSRPLRTFGIVAANFFTDPLIYSIAVHEYFQIMRTDMVNILSRFFSADTVHSSVCILKSAARKGVSSKHMYEKSIDTISRFIVLNDKSFILFLFWRRQDL